MPGAGKTSFIRSLSAGHVPAGDEAAARQVIEGYQLDYAYGQIMVDETLTVRVLAPPAAHEWELARQLPENTLGVIVLVGICGYGQLRPEAGAAKGAKKADTDLPPCVVKTVPADRAKDVDAALKEIKVTFDRAMKTEKSYSWIIQRNLGAYPGYKGSPPPRWEDDGRTCVLPVRLTPNTLYAVGANSFYHSGFRDTQGKVAVPRVWVFKTKKAE